MDINFAIGEKTKVYLVSGTNSVLAGAGLAVTAGVGIEMLVGGLSCGLITAAIYTATIAWNRESVMNEMETRIIDDIC